jgi:NAD(P)H-hydrate epimerase
VIPVLTPDEAATLEREAQAGGISADALMEDAGREVADAAVRLAGGVYGRRAVVVCGKGNNGGDGLVAARYLDGWGVRTTVILLEEGADLREPAASNLGRLAPTATRVRAFSGASLARELARADVVVDAIFGTGFRGAPEDAHAEAITALNASGVPVVAVDVPSGVSGETGVVEGEAVRADLTVTFGAAKAGLLLFPGAAHAGVVEVEPIGFPQDLIHSDLLLVEGQDVATMLPPREAEAHKRSAGFAVVVAGSRSMTGAAALAGSAAYRAGAGLVALAVPESILPVIQEVVREAVFVPLPRPPRGPQRAARLAWTRCSRRPTRSRSAPG